VQALLGGFATNQRQASNPQITCVTSNLLADPAPAPARCASAAPRRSQVEFGFTGEGSDAAPAPASLRGLDAAVYYRAGALLNCGHAAVRGLVLGALRHWAAAYGVDGFCFLNAETLVLGARPRGRPRTRAALVSALPAGCGGVCGDPCCRLLGAMARGCRQRAPGGRGVTPAARRSMLAARWLINERARQTATGPCWTRRRWRRRSRPTRCWPA